MKRPLPLLDIEGAWPMAAIDTAAHEPVPPDDRLLLFASAALLASEGRQKEAMDVWNLGVRSSPHLFDPSGVSTMCLLALIARDQAAVAIKTIVGGRAVDTGTLKAVICELDPALLRQWIVRIWDGSRVQSLEFGQDIVQGRATFASQVAALRPKA